MSFIDLQTVASLSILYTQPHRHYHNLEHVFHCLRELDKLDEEGLKIDFELIEQFIWFHDAIYDPKSKYNEIKSAMLFESWHKKNENNHKLNNRSLVSHAIRSTKEHINHQKNDENINLMFDVDLSIFGSTKIEYQNYKDNIRKEYSFVEDSVFNKNRIIILNNFLERKTIYNTDYYRDKYENLARNNIKEEIEFLSNS